MFRKARDGIVNEHCSTVQKIGFLTSKELSYFFSMLYSFQTAASSLLMYELVVVVRISIIGSRRIQLLLFAASFA